MNEKCNVMGAKVKLPAVYLVLIIVASLFLIIHAASFEWELHVLSTLNRFEGVIVKDTTLFRLGRPVQDE